MKNIHRNCRFRLSRNRHVMAVAPGLFWLRMLSGLALVGPASAQVVNSDWSSGSGNWNVAGNWSSADVPDNGGGITHVVRIGNLAAAAGAMVTFIPEDGTSDTVTSLALSGGAALLTNGRTISVVGETKLDGIGALLRVDANVGAGVVSLFSADLDVNSGGTLMLAGGAVSVGSLLEVNAGGELQGAGIVEVGDGNAIVEQSFENSGLLTVRGFTGTPGTLTLNSIGVDTLDLDGDTEAGVVDVSNATGTVELDALTLIVDGPLTDSFDGTLQIGQRDTLTFNQDVSLGTGAVIQMDGGTQTATLNGAGVLTSIAGAAFTVTGSAVIANDLAFSGTANTLTVNAASSLTLGGTVTLPDASALSFLSSTAQLIVTGNVNVTEGAGNFNWDGPGTASTTISGTGLLTLAVNQVDTSNDTFGGTLNLNDNADASVNVAGAAWTVAGTLNKNNAGTSTISGDAILVSGIVNANAGTLSLPVTTLQSTSQITVGGLLTLGNGSTLAGPGTLSGGGTLRMAGASTVSANTTVNVNTFDWDGTTIGLLHTISNGAVFTINSPIFDGDGEMEDAVSLGGNGAQLIINGPAEWTMKNTFTANSAAAGTATIGGSSRMILSGDMNVDGNTTINAPVTFNAGTTTSVDAGMTLDANSATEYAGGLITGSGTYDPASANTVTADSTISTANFDFDGGNWTVEEGAQLTVDVGDYEPDTAINAFNSTITLNSSSLSVTTGDPEFVMDGILNMNRTTGNFPFVIGEPLDIGNDAGSQDAELNIGGFGASQFGQSVDFNSDARVRVAANTNLMFLTASTVNFDTVNGANHATFTGPGSLSFSGTVNVNEAVALDMSGGTVDLDGIDSTGEFINIDAPFIIHAASMSSFGRTNVAGGINTLDINSNIGTGVLTVSLDDPAAEWTLNAPGVMNLINDAAIATLLAGNAVNLNGTVNVTGIVRVDARVDIGGTVNLNTASEQLTLNGGLGAPSPNTLAGGTINGNGLLVVPTGRVLHGFGTIDTTSVFSSNTSLRADDGTLNLTALFATADTVGTADVDGILNIVPAWNTNLASTVALNGGELRGGTVTVGNITGIQGKGLVSSKVINNTRLNATAGTLVVQTVGNDNDWDGATNAGQLRAESGSVLELRDTDIVSVGFSGSVVATGGSRVFTNGFGLDFNPGSSISLTSSTFEASSFLGVTLIGGTVTTGAGGTSTLKAGANGILTMESTSVTTLNGNLRMEPANATIEAGATFIGPGAIVIASGGGLAAAPDAVINVLLDNQGTFRVGGSDVVGSVNVLDYQQSATASLLVELRGTEPNQFDRLIGTRSIGLGGHLHLDIDGSFIPTLGQSFTILTADVTISGEFDVVTYSGLPTGLGFTVFYSNNAVRVTVGLRSAYEDWIEDRLLDPGVLYTDGAFGLAKGADPDHDGLTNIGEFALDGHPFKGGIPTKIFPKVASDILTLTVPVRNATVADPEDPVGGELALRQSSDLLNYHFQASDTLTTYPLTVTEITGAAATSIQAGLPAPSPGWIYRTFRSPGNVSGDPAEFMRVVITE